jgi:hypothetical protein
VEASFGSNEAGAAKYTYSAFPFCVLAAISLSTNLLFPWNNRLNGNKYSASPSMTNLSDSAKIRGSITSRHSEKEEEDDGIDAELLLPSVSITESAVVLPPISPLLTNTIPAGLVEGFVEGRIGRGKITER